MKNKAFMLTLLMTFPMLMSTQTIKVKAEESTLNNSIYEEDFETLNVGDNGDAIYNSKNLFWFDGGVTASVVEYNESKALQYKVNNNNEYTTFGGIGTGAISNLAKLTTGERYVFSADLSMTGITESSELFIEYQVNSWTGVKISNSDVTVLNNASTFDAKYENGKLTFTFIGGKKGDENGWIKITAHNYTSESSVVFDNFSIEKETLDVFDYDMNFENLAIGTSAPANNLSNIPNIYNETNELSIAINGDESNHYIEVSKNGTGSDVFDTFYINRLSKLVSDTNYRITMDILETNCTEFYICYNAGGQPCVTYNPSGYVGKDTNEYILGGSFDGKQLTFDFKPSVNKDATWWQQVAIIVKHSSDMILKMDNIKVFKLDNLTNAFTLDTSKVKLEYGLNEEFNLTNLEGTLVRTNGNARKVTQNEMILDTSLVNVTAKGTYQVEAKVVDEFGVVFTQSFEIVVKDYAEEFINEWKQLRQEGGENGICAALVKGSEARTKLDGLLVKYENLSETNKTIVDSTIDSGDATILDTMNYLKSLIALEENKTSNNADNGSILLISTLNSENYFIVIIGALMLVTCLGYFVLKTKKAK